MSSNSIMLNITMLHLLRSRVIWILFGGIPGPQTVESEGL